MLYANVDRIFDGFVLKKVLLVECLYCSKVMVGRPPDKSVNQGFFFYYFSTKTHVLGTHKNRLYESVPLSTQNICLT